MSRFNVTPIRALESRVVNLRKQIGDLDRRVEEVLAARDADLAVSRDAVADAERVLEAGRRELEEVRRGLLEVEVDALNQIERYRGVLKSTRDRLADLKEPDSTPLAVAKTALEDKERSWREALASVQSGEQRRLRSRLARAVEKLEVRLERKRNETYVTGTVPVYPRTRGRSLEVEVKRDA